MSDPTALLLLTYATCSGDSTVDRVMPTGERYSQQRSHPKHQRLQRSPGSCISPPETIATVSTTGIKTEAQLIATPNSLREIFANLPIPAPVPPTLQFGSIGPSVEQLQAQLQTLGYYAGRIDGQYGRLTRSAVFQFQRDRGISTNGIANSETWAQLARVSTGVVSRANTFIAPPKPTPRPQPQVTKPAAERQIQLASLFGVVALLCGGMGTFVLLKLAQERSH
ncbi:MAG: peptidoglycan-binding domain-containing protein, partial [Cyanobacteriota bacterium]|nr:peptidoglycan-binding domain-containing protein [Cyanobacteriota bacterium]